MAQTVGFVLVTHSNPMQTMRLVDTLNKMFDYPPIVCHHDFSKCIFSGETLGGNFSFVHPNVSTSWGMFSIVEAMLRAFQLMLHRRDCPDWLILLSGSDYPIKPADQIIKDLSSSPYDVHMANRKVEHDTRTTDWQKLRYKRYYATKLWIPHVTQNMRPTKRAVALKHPIFSSPFLPFSKEFSCYAGSQWFCANRKAVEHLIDFHQRKPALAHYYRSMDSFVVIPDESYFHTILCNSLDLTVSTNNWRYIDWAAGQTSPKMLLLENMSKIKDSSAHFARKFDANKDAHVLDELDIMIKQ